MPGTDVPEAFLPPTGLGPPVLGDPQQQRQRARPGGPVEAPRSTRSRPGGRSVGDGTPPILANSRLTGPRPTHTERRANERLAHQERMRRFREVVTSVFAKDLPEGTTPVLEGRPTAAGGSATERMVEVPPALRAIQLAIERNRLRRAAQPPADQATRRLVTEGPTTPDDWEVETPGGPVVAGEQRRQRRSDRAPRTLGGS